MGDLRHYEDICCFSYLGVLNQENSTSCLEYMIYPNMFGADMISCTSTMNKNQAHMLNLPSQPRHCIGVGLREKNPLHPRNLT